MRPSSFALYIFVGMVGILGTAITANEHPEHSDAIFLIGLTITCALFPLAYLARRRWDRARYGPSVTVDLKLYQVPRVCPETGRAATEPRLAQYTMTGGVATLHGHFPVMLAPEITADFDKRLLGNVKGLKVVRSVYGKITLHIKDEKYLQAMREANRETGAVSS